MGRTTNTTNVTISPGPVAAGWLLEIFAPERGRGSTEAGTARVISFLGTIGLLNKLLLPLRRGDNELWLAVSEDFGGWAVALQLPEPGDIIVVE